MTGVVEVADIADALKDHGLEPRGGFNFLASDDAPPAASGKHAASALLVGQVGAANWPYFQAWSDGKSPPPENPLDTWSREIIEKVAADFAARAVFPSDKPYLPFQTWAMRAERLRPSPLGILIHPEYGLWHAYRGALLFDEFIPSPSLPDPGFPCDDCAGKPCLSACPAGAISPSRYDVPACVGHVAGPGGGRLQDRRLPCPQRLSGRRHIAIALRCSGLRRPCRRTRGGRLQDRRLPCPQRLSGRGAVPLCR